MKYVTALQQCGVQVPENQISKKFLWSLLLQELIKSYFYTSIVMGHQIICYFGFSKMIVLQHFVRFHNSGMQCFSNLTIDFTAVKDTVLFYFPPHHSPSVSSFVYRFYSGVSVVFSLLMSFTCLVPLLLVSYFNVRVICPHSWPAPCRGEWLHIY